MDANIMYRHFTDAYTQEEYSTVTSTQILFPNVLIHKQYSCVMEENAFEVGTDMLETHASSSYPFYPVPKKGMLSTLFNTKLALRATEFMMTTVDQDHAETNRIYAPVILTNPMLVNLHNQYQSSQNSQQVQLANGNEISC